MKNARSGSLAGGLVFHAGVSNAVDFVRRLGPARAAYYVRKIQPIGVADVLRRHHSIVNANWLRGAVKDLNSILGKKGKGKPK